MTDAPTDIDAARDAAARERAATPRPDFASLLDLASERVGGRVVATNDDFFAEAHNLTRATEPVFLPDEYTDRGKWMDGWESRRRRTPGNDWAIVQLGVPGIVRGVDVDTAHFLGNNPEQCELRGCVADDAQRARLEQGDDATVQWRVLVARSDLRGGRHHYFAVDDDTPLTHVKLDIFPDGGVARLRVYGAAQRDWQALRDSAALVDLACADHCARVVACNDEFFSHRENLILPDEPRGMHDGWETRRRRGAGNDWIVVRLGHPGRIERAIVDTAFFKGNFPESVSLEAAALDAEPSDWERVAWQPLLARTPLGADARHEFAGEALARAGVVTHVRMSIYPDGGVARLRLLGVPEARS